MNKNGKVLTSENCLISAIRRTRQKKMVVEKGAEN